MSSREIRFSDAVNVPCESGEGRVRRGVADPPLLLLLAVVEVAVAAVVETDEVGGAGDNAPGLMDVVVEVDEEVEEFR